MGDTLRNQPEKGQPMPRMGDSVLAFVSLSSFFHAGINSSQEHFETQKGFLPLPGNSHTTSRTLATPVTGEQPAGH